MNDEVNYIDHLKGLSKDELEAAVESKISDTGHDLVDAEAVSSEMASSNATGWGMDVFEIVDVDLSHPNEARVRIGFTLSGDQEDEKPFCGTSIEGEALAIIDARGGVRYTNVTAERDLGDDDDGPEE
jgi:hypothetical protein